MPKCPLPFGGFDLLRGGIASALFGAALLHADMPTGGGPSGRRYGLVVHGGAGNYSSGFAGGGEAAHRAKLKEAVDAGYAVLDRGGTAMEAVVAAIQVFEESDLFDAGRGAVFNHEGFCELDAAVMDGSSLRAGAVAGVQHIKSPIALARDVMNRSPHVMLIGPGAEDFAKSLGYELVANDYFQSESRRKQWERARTKEKTAAEPHGTVGCAALDKMGNLAAGTSTGGTFDKKFGRVGDSPIIGAGTYANNATCAISATGIGEYFIREVAAYDVSAQMEYQGASLGDATARTLDKIGKRGGEGGFIAIDSSGNVTMPFNTQGMFRAFRLSDGSAAVKIFPNEK